MSIEAAHYLIDQADSVISDHITYINDPAHDWVGFSNIKSREQEFKVHVQLYSSMMNRVKFIVQEAGDEIQKDKKIKSFVSKCVKEFKKLDEKAKTYFGNNSITRVEVVEDITSEISFQDKILQSILKYSEDLRQIQLSEQRKDVVIKSYGDQIFAIPHLRTMINKFPDIKSKVSELINIERVL